MAGKGGGHMYANTISTQGGCAPTGMTCIIGTVPDALEADLLTNHEVSLAEPAKTK